MELSERWIKKFEDEGFASIYEHQDAAGTVYEGHSHKGRVSLFVTDGSIIFDFGGEKREVRANERFDVPVGAPHSAVVGPQGWIVIVGEEWPNVTPQDLASDFVTERKQSGDKVYSFCKKRRLKAIL